jgi:hypothetical protein
VLAVLLFASHVHAGGIMLAGTGISCPSTYPAAFADIPGAAGTLGAAFVQTDVCSAASGAGSTMYACNSNSTVTQINYSDAACTKLVAQVMLGSATSCIAVASSGAAFFSCESSTALPPFVLKDGGVLLSATAFNPSSGTLQVRLIPICKFIYSKTNIHLSLSTQLGTTAGHFRCQHSP